VALGARTATLSPSNSEGWCGTAYGEINAIASSIAAAVEEQGAATTEIARNVAETASAANEMTTRTTEVSIEAEQTGKRAVDVRGGGVRGRFLNVAKASPESPKTGSISTTA